MILADLNALAASAAPTKLDPVALFFAADIVVQLVIAGLVLASIWVWALMIGFSLRLANLRRNAQAFEADFFDEDGGDGMLDTRSRKKIPSARIAAAGIAEYRASHKAGLKDREGARSRIAMAMEGQVALEADLLAGKLGFLATTGSVAPFIGLFGTVWGIMNSFFQIGVQQNSSLAVVAPGISEALFATAIGLFAAIPAVIGYNRFSSKVSMYEAALQRFADKVHAQISREMEEG